MHLRYRIGGAQEPPGARNPIRFRIFVPSAIPLLSPPPTTSVLDPIRPARRGTSSLKAQKDAGKRLDFTHSYNYITESIPKTCILTIKHIYRMTTFRLFLIAAFVLAPPTAFADRNDDSRGRIRSGHEFEEEFRDGNCRVKRKLEKNGDYKEERECRGRRHAYSGRQYEEEFRDGNCKVKRKLEKDGDYKEERECKARRRAYYPQQPVYAPALPPVVVDPGITVHGTLRISP